MTQPERLLKLLRKGPATPLQIWDKVGIYRAADAVYRLRGMGHRVTTDMVVVKTREGCARVARYRLVK